VPPPPPTSPEGELFRLINASRAAQGCAPLGWDANLAASIRAHNEDQLRRGYFDHDTPEGEGPDDRLLRDGVPGFQPGGDWAENLSIDASVAAAHQSDMQEASTEPGTHRGNILDCRLTRVGISVLPTPDGRQLIGVLFLP
jgi:uncharacterized protein YkwD